jgi:hypothetical protein
MKCTVQQHCAYVVLAVWVKEFGDSPPFTGKGFVFYLQLNFNLCGFFVVRGEIQRILKLDKEGI